MVELDFSHYPAPEWNRPNSIIAALKDAQAANDHSSAMAAYNRVLYAIGNNHAGTYYPVAAVLVPALAPLLEGGQSWPRIAALEVLDDLTCSFEPEPGFESMTLSDGTLCSTEEALHRAIAGLEPLLQSIRNSDSFSREERELAEEILMVLETK